MSTKNKKLRQSFYTQPCVVCGSTPSDPCHIKSFGSGGRDELSNLIAMCRKHHTESHKIGLYTFAKKYPIFAIELKVKGWSFENNFGIKKLVRD